MTQKLPYNKNACRIGDKIVDVLNAEIAAGNGGVELLVGQLLAIKALETRMPPDHPNAVDILLAATDHCLNSAMAFLKHKYEGQGKKGRGE